MFCRKCGSQLPDGSAFCNKCGTKIVYLEEAPQPQLPPEPTVNGSNEQAASALKKPLSKKTLIIVFGIIGVLVIAGLIAFLIAGALKNSGQPDNSTWPYAVDKLGVLDEDGTLTINYTNLGGKAAYPDLVNGKSYTIKKIVIAKNIMADANTLGEALSSDKLRSVEAIEVEEGHPLYTVVDGVLYIKDSRSGEPKVLVKCLALKDSIAIAEGVTEIATDALIGCDKLTSIVLPDSLVSIGYGAFVDCSGITSMSLPAGVKEIKGDPFSGCSSLTALSIDADNPNYYTADGMVFGADENGAFNKLQFTLDSYKNIYVPYNVMTVEGVNNRVESVTLDDNVSVIGQNAFFSCEDLTTFNAGTHLEAIEGNAFSYCSSLERISFADPNSVTFIGEAAFNQSGLKEFTVSDRVTELYGYTFGGCKDLTVTIPSSVT